MSTFFDAQKQIGYRGSAAYEMCEVLERGGPIEDPDRTARLFLETFREISKQTSRATSRCDRRAVAGSGP
jgi:hypothetical protein